MNLMAPKRFGMIMSYGNTSLIKLAFANKALKKTEQIKAAKKSNK